VKAAMGHQAWEAVSATSMVCAHHFSESPITIPYRDLCF
jgi:hypothetical protein